MRPAWSVILFTTLSGAGYGVLMWLSAMVLTDRTPANALWILGAGAALVTVGLASSTFHLGRPGRAWRALSQWRSSWLSREGVAALLGYLPMIALGYGLWNGQASDLAAGALLAFSVVTVFCTAMIYASLKTVRAWNRRLVPVIYLVLSAVSGGHLYLALTGRDLVLAAVLVPMLLLAWLLKWWYWQGVAAPGISVASATGLTGSVRPLDPPHTADNYLLREMVFEVARRHVRRLQRLALVLGLVLPILAMIGFALVTEPGWLGQLIVSLGLASLALALLIERWLFFAQARHTVGLYYRTDHS